MVATRGTLERFALLVSLALALGAREARCAGLEIELTTAPDAPLAAQRSWHDFLASLPDCSVRLRPVRRSDGPRQEVRQAGSKTVVWVLALINARGELRTPDARFAPGDRDAARNWVKRVQDQADSPDPGGDPSGGHPGGDRLRATVSAPLTESTQGKPRWDCFDRLLERFDQPVVIDPAAQVMIRRGRDDATDLVADELRGLALGTALALLLEPAELGLRAPGPAGLSNTWVVSPGTVGDDRWPLGYEPEGSGRSDAPKLFEFFDVDLPSGTLESALAWFSARTELPIVVDRRALAERSVVPSEILVSLPPKRTAYVMALKGVLRPSRLTGKLRLDDAGRPWIWVTLANGR